MRKERTMADYYASTELDPLLDEIRTCFQEANARQETISLTVSNAGTTYPYVARRHQPTDSQQAREIAGKALELLRHGMATAAVAH